jgi:aspartate/methionine/tyrosine aminotransferase
VDKLVEAALKPATHRYSVSRGLPRLRKAICNWYKTRYDVDLDPETEAIVTIGSKEGLRTCAWRFWTRGTRCWCRTRAIPFIFTGR